VTVKSDVHKMLSYGKNPDGEVLVYYYWNVHREQLTNQNNYFRAAPQQPPRAEDEEKNRRACVGQPPPQAEDEKEKERGGEGRRGEEPRGSVNLPDAQKPSELSKKCEHIRSRSSVGSKRMRQHLGANSYRAHSSSNDICPCFVHAIGSDNSKNDRC